MIWLMRDKFFTVQTQKCLGCLHSHEYYAVENYSELIYHIHSKIQSKQQLTSPYPVQGVQPGALSAVALQHSQCPLRYAEG